MKRRFLPSTWLAASLFVFNFSLPISAQIFVKWDATGANTGASWTNAYTNLKTALSAATAGSQIWVAAGTYKPDGMNGSQTATFQLSVNLQLLGGFNGTETSANQRDPVLNETILSGDLNGNDVPDNFTTNRSDNVLHVVQVNANITSETLVDGVTIKGGQADGTTGQRDGGGMICSGKPVVRQCIFEQNAALEVGGAVQLNSIASPGAVFEDCEFNHNQANVGGGMNTQSSYFTLTGCSFTDNATVTGPYQANGGGFASTASSGVLQNCTFTGNSAYEYGGGIAGWIYTGFNGGSFEIMDCVFENNSAGTSNGAVGLAAFGDNSYWSVSNSDFIGNSSIGVGGLSIGVNSNAPFADNNHFDVTNCQFIGNTSEESSGGGLGVYGTENAKNSTYVIDSCFFSQNISKGGSGLVTFLGKETDFQLLNSTFTQNTGTEGYATAAVYSSSGGTGSAIVDNCVFQNNIAANSAGLDIGGGGDFDFTITNCDFLQNHADTTNAAFDIWGDVGSKLNFTIENCLLDGNTAGERAAGFWVIPASDDFHATMKNCRIVNNQSPKGAAIDIFREAVSGFPALVNASFTVENCLIANNSSDGGVVTLDTLRHFNLLNCTIADNTGGGILNGNLGGITLQNTILHNPGFTEYTAATNDATFTSHGGNLIGDGSLGSDATPWDLQNTDPLFVGTGDFHLSASSPAIDKGVDLGNLPATDLDGNARVVGCPDIGAYESAVIVSTDCVVGADEASAGASGMTISPNPATDFLNFQLPETTTAPLEVQVFDAQGRLLRRQLLAAGQALDLQGLAVGMYSLKVVVGERVYAGKFIKQ